jgi:hypothetical protein
MPGIGPFVINRTDSGGVLIDQLDQFVVHGISPVAAALRNGISTARGLRIECCSVTRLMICVLPPLGEC